MISRTTLSSGLAFLLVCLASQRVEAAPKLPSEHPRVYLRASDLPAIQQKLTIDPFAASWTKVQQSPAPVARAFVYLLTGDQTAGKAAIVDGLTALKACSDARLFDQAMHWGACVYDWCYPLLTDAQKKNFQAEFARIANLDVPYYPAKSESMAVVGHGTEGWLLSGQLPAGVAIFDESPDMYNAGASLFFDSFVPVRNYYYPSHMHHQGDSYVSRFEHDLAATWLFRRLGAGDVLSAEQQYVPYRLIYGLRPDGQQLRSGDTYDDSGRDSAKRIMNLLTGSYYGNPYLLGMADSDKNYWSLGVYYDILSLLFRPDGIGTLPISELPQAKFFGAPMGEMIARTGWSSGIDSKDAVIQMRIGGTFFGNHQRKDWGTFQVYYRGPLAISSGVYEGDNSPYGSEHWLNYHHQTISHNGLLVLDPSEKATLGGKSIANDGGQRWPNGGADHPTDLPMIKSKGYETGIVTAHATGPDPKTPRFSYIAGDITGAYSPTKVSEVRRSMVTWATGDPTYPATLVVFDRVTATDPSFKKTWLLHSIQQPSVSGSTVTILRDEPTYDKKGNYGGKLVAESLLPDGAKLNVVGGSGKEFWIDSTQTNYAVTKAAPAEPGAWRVETTPSKAQATDQFLHVLSVMDSTVSKGPTVTRIDSSNWVGALVGNHAALFSRSGALLDGGSFQLKNLEKSHILICDLKPGAWMILRDGQLVSTMQASEDAHSLYFEGVGGDYELRFGTPPDAGTDAPIVDVQDAPDDSSTTSDGNEAGSSGIQPSEDGEGCGCRVGRKNVPSAAGWIQVLGLIVAADRYRRRRSERERVKAS